MADSLNNLENALYIVATPIGNLADITLRAIETLKQVDVIAAEDTRNTTVLLNKYSITTRLISYHKFSESSRVELFLNYLKEGKSIALVSDAGTPLICDPGSFLVKEVRSAGFKVIPIPGVSTITTLLSAVSKTGEDFKFVGFMPRQKNKIEQLVLDNKKENLVFYESPNRLIETLNAINEIRKEAKIAIGRELTKKFEEIKIDTAQNLIKYYTDNLLKGEIAAMILKEETLDDETNSIEITEKIEKLKKLNLKDKEIAAIIATLFNVNKNAVYKKCLEKN